MAKIPKGLSDKDMLQGYVEQVTMESQFLAAEAAEDKKRQTRAFADKSPQSIALSGFDDELVELLGKKLLELKLELLHNGITKYTMKVKREGSSIVITPVERQNKNDNNYNTKNKNKRK